MPEKNKIISKTRISTDGLSVEVVQKRIKNLYLRVYPETGRVVLSAPAGSSVREAESFIRSKIDWIQKHLSRKSGRISLERLSLADGSLVPVWGEMKRVRVYETNGRCKVECRGETDLVFRIRKKDDFEKCRQMLQEFYRRELKYRIPLIIARFETPMGVQVREFGVKKMKTRWGSCNIRAGRIWLNLELAMRNPAILEYIVVHEMVHLLERLHNKRFNGFMDRFIPDWREREKLLQGGLKSC